MKKRAKEEGCRWLEQAKADLHGATVLFENHIYHMVCFICQQTAEKALKAYLYAQGEEIVTGHSVAALCDWAENYNRSFAKLREDISMLDSFYIATRYPNGLPDGIPAKVFNRKPAKEALRMAKTAVDFVENLLE
jgi:HEPN domain-containing protein